MKQKILALSLALAALGVAGTVQAQDTNGAGAFVGAKVGSVHWKTADASTNRVAYGATGGYRWSLDANQSLGPEIGYTNFGKLRQTGPLGSASLGMEAATLGANYRYTFGQGAAPGPYFVQGRAGYLRWHATDKARLAGVSSTSHDNGNGWYAGAAVGRDFTPNFGVTLGYDFHRANMDGNRHANFGVASVGAEYRF